jgi:hypothetical protein
MPARQFKMLNGDALSMHVDNAAHAAFALHAAICAEHSVARHVLHAVLTRPPPVGTPPVPVPASPALPPPMHPKGGYMKPHVPRLVQHDPKGNAGGQALVS